MEDAAVDRFVDELAEEPLDHVDHKLKMKLKAWVFEQLSRIRWI